ncbi:MAG: hypothetical protein H6704_09140 [Myxococcales bacterium]|nr:hypothetical protein [Myxococcales bacterium]
MAGDLDPARAGRAVRRAFLGRGPVRALPPAPRARPADLRLTAAGDRPRRVVAWPVAVEDAEQAARLQVLGAWMADVAGGEGVDVVPHGELARRGLSGLRPAGRRRGDGGGRGPPGRGPGGRRARAHRRPWPSAARGTR